MNSNLRSIAALVLACVIQLSGTGKLNAQDNDCWVKIAFLGHYTDYNSFISSSSYPLLCQTYPDLQSIDKFAVDDRGEELYLVIPSEGYDITVSSCPDEINGKLIEGDILYKTEDGFDTSLSGKPFLVQCNVDLPNVQLVIAGAEGVETYSPHIDLEQGRLAYHARVRDISRPLPQSGPDESVLYADMGISAMVKKGKVVLSLDLDKLRLDANIKNYEKDRYVSREVSGTNGICRQVFIGSRGAKMEPWLCLLMDDGTARILNLIEAIYEDDFYASPELPGFSDIISFEEGGTGEYMPGRFSYQTIFGIDKDGGRHEIPVFLDAGEYTYEALTKKGYYATLTLRSNWRMNLLLEGDQEIPGNWVGSFFEAVTRDDSSDFNFRLTDETEESGTFRLTAKDDKYILTPLSGFALYGKVGKEIELEKER